MRTVFTLCSVLIFSTAANTVGCPAGLSLYLSLIRAVLRPGALSLAGEGVGSSSSLSLVLVVGVELFPVLV